MQYIGKEIITNIKRVQDIPSDLGGAVYVWFALNPKGTTRVNTSYIGQSGKIRSRTSGHKDKLNGDMDLLIFNLKGSTETHRQVIENLLYRYVTTVGGGMYRRVCLNMNEPTISKTIPLQMIDESYGEFVKIANELQDYLGIKTNCQTIDELTYLGLILDCKELRGINIIEPDISTKQIKVYNPLHKGGRHTKSKLVKGSIIQYGGDYYTYTNKMGRPYYTDEELLHYLKRDVIDEWFEPLERIVTDKQLQYIGRSK